MDNLNYDERSAGGIVYRLIDNQIPPWWSRPQNCLQISQRPSPLQ